MKKDETDITTKTDAPVKADAPVKVEKTVKADAPVKKAKLKGAVNRPFKLHGFIYGNKAPVFETSDKKVFDSLIKKGLISNNK